MMASPSRDHCRQIPVVVYAQTGLVSSYPPRSLEPATSSGPLGLLQRPDIAYAAMALGQFNASPTRSHLACARGVLHYLAGTVHLCLQFPFTSSHPISRPSKLPSTCTLSDADWASNEKDRKSISGYCFFFMDSLVSWSSQKQ